MSSHKIKILGIAPYEGMKSMMLKLASKREDIDLTVYVGDLNEGVEIAKRNLNSNFDVIISRGGTAEMISEITNIPLIEVTLSVYDILRAIKLAENYSDRYAIVGFQGITNSAQLLCDLLQYKIDIFTIHNVDEVQTTLEKLKAEGYRMVLCDMITTTLAKRIGLNAILITSGDESIMSAFDQAIKVYKSYIHVKEDYKLLVDVLSNHDKSIFVFDEDTNEAFSCTHQTLPPEINTLLKKETKGTIDAGAHKWVKTLDETVYTISSKRISNQGRYFAAFYIETENCPLPRSKNGIKYSNKSEIEDTFFNSFYSVTHASSEEQYNLEQMSLDLSPVMIAGEEGTGKTQIARLLYTKSTLSNNPFVTIDCTLLQDKGMSFLLNHHNSPFLDTNSVIFIKDLQVLSDQKSKLMLSAIIEMEVQKQNKLIISFAKSADEKTNMIYNEYLNQLSCLSIRLSPLKEKTSEIPTLSSLYLSTLNLDLSKQIIGFEQEAFHLLQNYEWPTNYTQFKRLIKEMAVLTSSPYITSETVKKVLEKENDSTPITMSSFNTGSKMQPFGIDSSLTLDDMNRMIISHALEQNKGNHSTTAKQLGISRTTLWRYLK